MSDIHNQVYKIVELRANKLASDSYKALLLKHKRKVSKIYPITHPAELGELQSYLSELCDCSKDRAEEICSVVTSGQHHHDWLK